MFEYPKYIRNSYGISFVRQLSIRRYANQFEDLLKGNYSQPHIISVPDDLNPEVPRMIFDSQHGFSQIIISQINVTLNVTYSPDWQENISNGKNYLLNRIPTLFDLLEKLEDTKPCFSGIVTLVHLPVLGNESTFIDYLSKLSLGQRDISNLYDVHLKTAEVYSNRFFSNLTIKNYRLWKFDAGPQVLPRLSHKKVFEQGIEIIGDFNDRYMYNENSSYFTDPGAVEEIITTGLEEVHKTIEKVKGLQL